MSRANLHVVPTDYQRRDLEGLVERWMTYVAMYEASEPPENLHGESYTYGYHSGLRRMALEAALAVREALR